MCFFCWIKPSSVLESNILFPTHVIPTRLTKVGCVLFPDSGQEPGGPSLPGVPTSLKGPGACLLCHMEAKARQRTGLHVQLWLMKLEFWNDGKSESLGLDTAGGQGHGFYSGLPDVSFMLCLGQRLGPAAHPGVPQHEGDHSLPEIAWHLVAAADK